MVKACKDVDFLKDALRCGTLTSSALGRFPDTATNYSQGTMRLRINRDEQLISILTRMSDAKHRMKSIEDGVEDIDVGMNVYRERELFIKSMSYRYSG